VPLTAPYKLSNLHYITLHGPLCTTKRPTYDIASISETTTPINMKFQDNIWTTKMCPAVQYCDVITNPRWRTAAILKIAKSPYLSEHELSYRQQIARQLRTQYADGIYRHKYYTVTLKSRLSVTRGHWKRNHWIDHTRLSSSRVI